ncbi:hypothetical protein [Leeuwenhoekiella sp. W20_SRS_FM14]|uniref:hypothetical protein n=1 Tax=Leeuwenhoekiella sp. W20_SRS_FM14 TaxID=3240270 RepID=UPI003F9E924C
MKGILEVYYNYFSNELKSKAFYAACFGFLFFLIALFPLRNTVIRFRRIVIPSYIRVLLVFLYLIAFILTYPRRFHIDIGVQSGSICLVFSVLLICSKKSKFDFASVLHLIVLAFAILVGERVDAMMAVILHLIFDKNSENYLYLEEKISTKYFYPLMGGIFGLGILGELLRADRNFNMQYLLSSVFTQSTTVDVSFIYLTGWYYNLKHGVNTDVLLNFFFGFLPGEYNGISSEFNFTEFLRDKVMANPGGGLYYTEGIIAFGFIGVVVYGIFLAFLIRFIIVKSNKNENSLFFNMLLVLILIMQLRIQWYGFIYFYTPAFLILVLSVLIKINRIYLRN